MPKFVIRLVCGHAEPITAKREPRYLDTEEAWSFFWCYTCEKAIRVARIDG